jgi:hypothetical protein
MARGSITRRACIRVNLFPDIRPSCNSHWTLLSNILNQITQHLGEMMNVRAAILGFLWKYPLATVLLAVALAGLVTGPKIYKMFQIRGTVPGAIIEKQVVTDKSRDVGRRGEEYWEVTTDKGANERISFEKWSSLQIGDQIEMVKIPGDNDVYAKDGIFADDSNFIVDYVLFALEIAAIVFFVFRFLRLRNTAVNATA